MTFRHEAQVPSTVWILVADRARARLFESEWPDMETLNEIQSCVHPESAEHPRNVESDDRGGFASFAGGQNSGDPEVDYRHREANTFASVLVDRLEEGRTANAFGRLILFAPALLLGVLRSKIHGPLGKLLVDSIDKELTREDVSRILTEVHEVVAAAS